MNAPKCEFFNCGDREHVECGICGGPVCLGGISDYQRERVIWRAKADRKPITHFGCVPNHVQHAHGVPNEQKAVA